MKNKIVNIVFRLDDFSAVSSTDIERRIIGLFREHRAAVTLGVIPFVCAQDIADPSRQSPLPLPADKVEILRAGVEDGTIDVALHGYSHQTAGVSAKTEFAGLVYGDQLEKLARGKAALEKASGSPVRIFIPPWNSYDLNTIQALDQLQINIISAGWNGAAAPQTSLRFLPATTDIMHLFDAVAAARRSPDTQPLIVALFHLYDFTEVGMDRGRITFHEFTDVLNWIEQQQDIQVLSIGQAVDSIEDLRVNRFLAIEAWRAVQTVTPLFLREKTPILLYHETGICWKALRKLIGFYALLAMAFVICAGSIGFLYFAASNAARLIAASWFLISGITIVYAFLGLKVSPGSIVSAARVIGDSLGLLWRSRSLENP
jgi:hypothetical protein